MLRLAVCFLACLACASSASGTVLIEDLAAYQKSPASGADDYIEGVIKGIFVASNELEFKGRKGLVCPPQDQFKFEPQLAAKILSEYLEKHAPKADPKEDIAVPMIYALRCGAGSPNPRLIRSNCDNCSKARCRETSDKSNPM